MSTPIAHEYIPIIVMIYRLTLQKKKLQKEVDLISICSCEFKSNEMNEKNEQWQQQQQQ